MFPPAVASWPGLASDASYYSVVAPAPASGLPYPPPPCQFRSVYRPSHQNFVLWKWGHRWPHHCVVDGHLFRLLESFAGRHPNPQFGITRGPERLPGCNRFDGNSAPLLAQVVETSYTNGAGYPLHRHLRSRAMYYWVKLLAVERARVRKGAPAIQL